MDSYKTDFANAGDKDEVDAKEAALTKNLRNNYSYRLQLLNDIVAVHGMEDVEQVAQLRTRYGKDYERLGSRIGQLADQRKS
jgi:hypothetical protein